MLTITKLGEAVHEVIKAEVLELINDFSDMCIEYKDEYTEESMLSELEGIAFMAVGLGVFFDQRAAKKYILEVKTEAETERKKSSVEP